MRLCRGARVNETKSKSSAHLFNFGQYLAVERIKICRQTQTLGQNLTKKLTHDGEEKKAVEGITHSLPSICFQT